MLIQLKLLAMCVRYVCKVCVYVCRNYCKSIHVKTMERKFEEKKQDKNLL